jgi:hypothetical protein
MSNWTARLKSELLKTGLEGTAKTDIRGVSSVTSVPPGAVYHFPDRLSSVSSVGVWSVFENTQLASDLIEAAMKVCDQHGDGEAARQEMRRDCMELSPRLQLDLLQHFTGIPVTFE